MNTNTDTSSSGHDHTAPPPSNTSHPVFAVNNIKNSIPLLLNKQGVNYTSWVELFHIHACAHDVLDHIDASVPRPPSVDAPTWDRIDAIVKQWIYSTISKDLLQTIIKPRATAHELWTHLEELFQDDKHATTTTTATLIQPAVDPLPDHTQLETTNHPPSGHDEVHVSMPNLPENDAELREAKKALNSAGTPGYVDLYKTERIAPSLESRGRSFKGLNLSSDNKQKEQKD